MAVTAAVDIANIALTRLGQATIDTLTDSGRDATVMNAIYPDVRDYCLNLCDWDCLIIRSTLDRSGSLGITDISNASPAVVTATGHVFVTGEMITIESAGGLTTLNGGAYRVFSYTSTTITLHDTAGAAVDTSSAGSYTSGGLLYRYAGADWEWVYDLPSDYVRVLDVLDDEQGYDVYDMEWYPAKGYQWVKERDYVYTEIENASARYIRRDTDVTNYEDDLIEVIASRLAWYASQRINSDKAVIAQLKGEYEAALQRAKMTDGRGRSEGGRPPELWTSIR